MIYKKMTALRETDLKPIRQDLTLKRIWRLVRMFFKADIANQVTYKTRKC
jgi:hypothetical protein